MKISRALAASDEAADEALDTFRNLVDVSVGDGIQADGPFCRVAFASGHYSRLTYVYMDSGTYQGLRPIPEDDLIEQVIVRARDGDWRAGQELLARFVSAGEFGRSSLLTEHIADCVSDWIRAGIDQTSAHVAQFFRARRPRGVGADPALHEREVRIVLSCLRRRANGEKPGDAESNAALEHFRGPDTAKKLVRGLFSGRAKGPLTEVQSTAIERLLEEEGSPGGEPKAMLVRALGEEGAARWERHCEQERERSRALKFRLAELILERRVSKPKN